LVVMSSDTAPQTAGEVLDHRLLRSAIEFAVVIAAEGQKLRPPLAYPAALKPFLRQHRVPTSALGRLRRAIEADDGFRRRLAAGALPELVDPVGLEWLRRDDGWEQRAAQLVAAAAVESARAGDEGALRRSEKRREAAEQAATRTRAELVTLQARVDDLQQQLDGARQAGSGVRTQLDSLRAEASAARRDARHANDRAEAARARVAGLEADRDAALHRAEAAESQRDALLADRAERGGVEVSGAQVMELRDLSRSARGLADRLASLIEVGTTGRVALSLPGGVARNSQRATEYLLRAPGALVLVDGYNVAKLAWPSDDLERQRAHCLDLADDIARRYGTDITVVFDGAEVIGAHATGRRMARVVYSKPGVSADDVIRAEVRAAPVERPVVVATNDQAIRRDVAAAGANWITSDALLAVR
jgi:YacP-like NYN domain